MVGTFATINELRLNYSAIYKNLREKVSLVIVDEGHYEPAVEWGKSVKGLMAKTVLLTATPYRNDLKLFRIRNPKEEVCHYTHQAAVDDGIIREVRFDTLGTSTDLSTLAQAFATKWLDLKKKNGLPSRDPRAIICCENSKDIEAVVDALNDDCGVPALGIHERFKKPKNKNYMEDVPLSNPAVKAEVWVHQHKLTEGLDDNRFCCLALFTRIRNDRKLVQQTGRILRKATDDRQRLAVVMAPDAYSPADEWASYRAFETNLELIKPEHFRTVVEAGLAHQPAVEYFDGCFRKRFDPSMLASDPQVIISPSVRVRAISSSFSLDEYVEDCTDTLNTNDAVILGPDINAPCQRTAKYALWVYATVTNSRYLRSTSLYEIRLETHCVVVANGFLVMADSCGYFPEESLDRHTTLVPVNELGRFLDKRFRPTHVSIDSAIPYNTVVRGADLRGNNLLHIPASLTDRIQICRAARGSSKNHGRRYLGLENSRLRQELSDEERRTFTPKDFQDWAQEVTLTLKSGAKPSALFDRYMPTCVPPANPVPQTICLDLFKHDVDLTLSGGQRCILLSSASDVLAKPKDKRTMYLCKFELAVKPSGTTTITLQVDYQPARRRFWFSKYDGASIRAKIRDDVFAEKSLVEFLNQKQDVVLIGLSGGDIVYQGRRFYRVDYSFAEQSLVDRIIRLPAFPKCTSEKGNKKEVAALKKKRATQFLAGTLFRAVADNLVGLPFNATVLICDDLGNESADFIAANFKERKLAFIHAKAGKGDVISAGAFHVVVAQAMKNLVFLTRNAETPTGAAKWADSKYWNGTRIPMLLWAPKNTPTRTDLWKKIKSEIIESSNPELYVMLVTSGCCEANAIRDAAADKAKRTPQLAKIVHLLDGLNGYARQLGVQLLVSDLPYGP